MLRVMKRSFLVAFIGALAVIGPARAAGLEVVQEGKSPDLKVRITSPGVYKAEVWQASGGGIMRFFDLASDPDAKVNLAAESAGRGLFEIGWHGAHLKANHEKEDCCGRPIVAGEAGKRREGGSPDGCRDWPSTGHKRLKAEGTLEIIEESAARVRVRAKSVFVWWSKYADKDLPVEAIYTFYPTGRVAIQVRVRRTGTGSMHWSGEYGPHLMVPGHSKKPEIDRGFVWSTAKDEKTEKLRGPSTEFILTTSEKVKASFMLTIPAEAHKLFSRHMRHNGRGIGWDRAGYGSSGVVMAPGYDNTWACMIQMGTSGSDAVPEIRSAKDALAVAMQYRKPPKPTVKGAVLVTDDPGDFNRDGFNEAEGCYVLKGAGPLEIAFPEGKTPAAPAFKVLEWKGDAPKSVKIDGAGPAAASAVVGDTLVIQVLGR